MLCSQIYLSKVIKKNLLSLDCNKYKAEQDYWWIQETNVSKLDLITFVRWMVSFILLYHLILKDIYLGVCVCVCLLWDEYRMHTRVSFIPEFILSANCLQMVSCHIILTGSELSLVYRWFYKSSHPITLSFFSSALFCTVASVFRTAEVWRNGSFLL